MNSWRTIGWGLPILVVAILVAIGVASTRADAPPRGLASARDDFAGGCFWCMEPPFEKIDGVVSVTSGYTGGKETAPSYKEVSAGRTGHVEAVQVKYDPAVVSYEYLLKVFWRQIDPTDDGGQFADRGTQYRTAIFAYDRTQHALAKASKRELEKSGIFKDPDRDASSMGRAVLRSRGLSPGLLQKKPRELQALPHRVGPRGLPQRRCGASDRLIRPRNPKPQRRDRCPTRASHTTSPPRKRCAPS